MILAETLVERIQEGERVGDVVIEEDGEIVRGPLTNIWIDKYGVLTITTLWQAILVRDKWFLTQNIPVGIPSHEVHIKDTSDGIQVINRLDLKVKILPFDQKLRRPE